MAGWTARATAGDDLAALLPPLRAYIAKRAPGPDAEDLVQEVMLRLHQRGTGDEPIANVQGYLFRTAASVLADHARRRTVRRAGAHDSLEDHAHPVEGLTPDRVLEGRETLDRLIAAIAKLDEGTRNVFVLHRFEEMTYPAIARHLGVSVSTVEKRIMKALRHFAERGLP
ncbi:MAG: sigma-70 family RNA polymerase sigma factor [Sphingomonas fennica]